MENLFFLHVSHPSSRGQTGMSVLLLRRTSSAEVRIHDASAEATAVIGIVIIVDEKE
jgi:hypothetical protein